MRDFRKGWNPTQPDSHDKLAGRLDELRSTLRLRDPVLVAARSGASYLEVGPDRGELHVPLWGNICILSFPELAGCNNHDDRLSDFQQTLLLYYLTVADGAPLTGKWVSFAELPDGRIYNAAFQGYTGNELVKAFGTDLDMFLSACSKSGGNRVELGSACFFFQALPRVPLMVTYWLGDEDFPSASKILFDESVSHYLPIDACAVLGSMLIQKLLRS